MRGVFLPIVTPFLEGKIDVDSYTNLLRYYLGTGISGFIPLGTTGEVPTIEEDEYRLIIETTIQVVGSAVPVYAGISSNSTKKAVHLVQSLSEYPLAGYLVTSPYYNLPSQQGIYDHFRRLSEETDRDIIIYNIPYRTGRNIENDTIFRLSKISTIRGIKDSCGSVGQTIELLRERAPGFSVMTGEDVLFYFNIVHGGSGGILAAAHVRTDRFVKIYNLVQKNDHQGALGVWNQLSRFIPLLFKEPNPAPIKYILAKKQLIRSAEVRQPLAPISEGLRNTFDRLIAENAL